MSLLSFFSGYKTTQLSSHCSRYNTPKASFDISIPYISFVNTCFLSQGHTLNRPHRKLPTNRAARQQQHRPSLFTFPGGRHCRTLSTQGSSPGRGGPGRFHWKRGFDLACAQTESNQCASWCRVDRDDRLSGLLRRHYGVRSRFRRRVSQARSQSRS